MRMIRSFYEIKLLVVAGLLLIAGQVRGLAADLDFHSVPTANEVQSLERPYNDYPLPDSLALCGEPIPLEIEAVWEMLDREFTMMAWDRAQVFLWLKRAGKYFPFIERKLAEASMPDDLKYLAVAESSLLTYVRSSAGAAGSWQFMAETARRHGLRKDRRVDERLSFEHATEAALRYLQDLHSMFGSWTLALAAYNCGEKRVAQEIEEQQVAEYFRLNLPRETERFIFRIAAIKTILENPERYGYRLSPERTYKPQRVDRVEVKIVAPLRMTDLAKALGTDFKTIKELNPQFLGYEVPKGIHQIKVPSGTGDELKNVLARLTQSAVARRPKGSARHHVVRRGDTLTSIAQTHDLSLEKLKAINGLSDSHILIGQKLRLVP